MTGNTCRATLIQTMKFNIYIQFPYVIKKKTLVVCQHDENRKMCFHSALLVSCTTLQGPKMFLQPVVVCISTTVLKV